MNIQNISRKFDITFCQMYNIYKLIKLFKLLEEHILICKNKSSTSSCNNSNKLEDYKKNIDNYSCESVWCVSPLYDLLMVM